VSIDTLKLARRLVASGMSTEQAESMAEVLGDAIGETAISKPDLILVETRLAGEMRSLRWIMGVLLAVAVAILFRVYA
jgi:hypothetical protein